ncbi:hypothetical protein PENSUB_5154 [Penicillium subrubescens]|uniref:Uncharacterized protein n=1 Tax=Penicillium subrubescens TaxID=1316194 RepID=A0A1Q5UAK5_9EURO|nr:hypothetical protein PENSUB_5154 [Penicillium subrubescens]
MVMSDDNSFFSRRRQALVSYLFDRFQNEWNVLSPIRGKAGSASADTGASSEDISELHQIHVVFMEICLVLFCIGDVFGYISTDVQGLVDPVLSDDLFLEGFLVCMEITHVSCLKHLDSQDTVKKPGFDGGLPMIYRAALVDSPYQKVLSTRGKSVDITRSRKEAVALSSLSSLELLGLFLDVSKGMCERAQKASVRDGGLHEPSMVSLNAFGALSKGYVTILTIHHR